MTKGVDNEKKTSAKKNIIMQAKMKFYPTEHFTEKNPFDLNRVEQMLADAYAIKERLAYCNIESVLQASREHGEKLYAYHRAQKSKWVIVLGKDRAGDDALFNALVTIYKVDTPGWICRAYQALPVKRRQTIAQYLKFKRAVITTEPVQAVPVKVNPRYKRRTRPILLTVHEFGLNLKRRK